MNRKPQNHKPNDRSDLDSSDEEPLSPSDEEPLNRERGLDKTLADSYPASDPLSSIPDPVIEEVPAEKEQGKEAA